MGPTKILFFWESGGASRLNADDVSSPCDLVTEREITGSLRVHTERIPYLQHGSAVGVFADNPLNFNKLNNYVKN